jgi:hypothetical protein
MLHPVRQWGQWPRSRLIAHGSGPVWYGQAMLLSARKARQSVTTVMGL